MTLREPLTAQLAVQAGLTYEVRLAPAFPPICTRQGLARCFVQLQGLEEFSWLFKRAGRAKHVWESRSAGQRKKETAFGRFLCYRGYVCVGVFQPRLPYS